MSDPGLGGFDSVGNYVLTDYLPPRNDVEKTAYREYDPVVEDNRVFGNTSVFAKPFVE